MKEKVYKDDHFENIKIFNDVKYPKEFSAYSSDLNRFFGDRSYPKFYKNLLENKKLASNYFKKLFEKENKVKGLKLYEESFNIGSFKNSLDMLKIKEIEYTKKLKNPYFERINNSKNFIKTENIKKKPYSKIVKPLNFITPEVGRYNPSYNYVNKHIYEVSFSKTGLNELPKNINNNINNNERKKILNKSIDKIQNKSKTLKTINNKKYTKTEPITPKKKIHSLNVTQNNKSRNALSLALNKVRNNHCLKFENYTIRKPLIRELDYNTEYNTESPNYYTSKYLKGNVDFNKLSSNKNIKSYFDEIANKEHNPPLGLYQPKYNSIMSKTRDIYFTKRSLPSSRHRKFKKIIYSYNVPYNYQIAPSLNDRTIKADDFYK